MRFMFEVGILKHMARLIIYKKITLENVVVGINSNIKKSKEWWQHHFLMLDYDNNLSLDSLKHEIKWLQKKFMLGDCHIFESSFNHYNVMFFYEDMDYFDALKIIHVSSACKRFKEWRMVRREMTIRITPKTKYDKKPELAAVIKSKYKKHLSKEQKKIMEFVLGECKND